MSVLLIPIALHVSSPDEMYNSTPGLKDELQYRTVHDSDRSLQTIYLVLNEPFDYPKWLAASFRCPTAEGIEGSFQMLQVCGNCHRDWYSSLADVRARLPTKNKA